eukprot:3423746-Amphidinium_carterae.1
MEVASLFCCPLCSITRMHAHMPVPIYKPIQIVLRELLKSLSRNDIFKKQNEQMKCESAPSQKCWFDQTLHPSADVPADFACIGAAATHRPCAFRAPVHPCQEANWDKSFNPDFDKRVRACACACVRLRAPACVCVRLRAPACLCAHARACVRAFC